MTSLLKNKIFIYIIPFLIGLISSYSLPPYSFFFINFFTFPTFLFLLILNYSKGKKVLFAIGWMFGFGYFISNLYWITNSLTFEDIFKPLIPLALTLIPLFLGLFYGLAALIFSLFNIKKNFTSIIIFSFSLSLIEYIRSFIFGGFPWNLVAYSFAEYLNLIQILSIIGTYSLNLLSITIFLLPTIFLFEYKKKTKFISLLLVLSILIVNFIFGELTIKKFEKTKKNNLDFTIKIVSPQIDINRFFQNENPEKIISDLIKIAKPDTSKETIFIFPEGIISSIYLQDLKKYSSEFSNNFSDKHKIILGINSYEDSKVYNSLVVIDKDVNILSKYYKNKLVPFGEFLPYEKFFNKLGFKKITQGYQSFSSHNRRDTINLNNFKFIPLICYEIIYSGKINKYNDDYDFILNISEDGWFGNSIGPYQHFSHSIFRSIEEGKYVIRSTNNGISAFINSKGQIINKILTTKKGFIELKSFKDAKKTIFSSYGNKIFFYFLAFYISLIFFLKKKENK